ncbi:MAG: hypothetical protein AAGJ95_13940 [Cyanobacteria bacterium J06554_11]
MTEQKQTKGRVSVWRRDSGKLKASGNVQISPELLVELANLPTNQYGQVELDLALFTNSDKQHGDRRPEYTGYLQAPRDQQQSAPAPQPTQAPQSPLVSDDYLDEIPF